MKLGGNLLTHYRYRLVDIEVTPTEDQLAVRITTAAAEADLHVVARLAGQPAALPPSSPFRSDRDARRFAGPLPWTFDYEPQTRSIVMIRGRRSQWQPRQVAVEVKTGSFLEQAPFGVAEPRLASAFHVTDLDYSWQRGVRVPIGQA
jgi:hypothetical protein